MRPTADLHGSYQKDLQRTFARSSKDPVTLSEHSCDLRAPHRGTFSKNLKEAEPTSTDLKRTLKEPHDFPYADIELSVNAL